MSRNIVKVAVVLLVAVLVHSVFWFFKTGQLEKHVNNFVAENSGNVSIAEIKVSGYPFSQKVTISELKFSIPNPAFSKYQVVVKQLEAKAGIFNNNFTVELVDKVAVQDADNNMGSVEFAQAPQIAFSLARGMIAHFSYSDSGYRVFDIDKNVVYAASSSSVTLDSAVDANEQITSKLNVAVKDIEGFGILDIYKNSSEKKIIDGIKTGEIVIGGGAGAALIGTDPSIQAASIAPAMAAANAAAVVPAAGSPAVAAVNPATPAADAAAAPVVADAASNPATVASAPADAVAAALAAASADNVVKSNLMIDFEYILTPNKNEQQATVPLDPTQMQDAVVQYSRAIKINNLEFSNPLYKITINGQVNSFQDDNTLSGFVTVRVENIAALANYISTGFTQLAEQKQIMPEVQSSDLSAQSPSQGTAYQDFLKKISAGIISVSTELSAKNQLTKDNVAVFDMRREKNLEFVINETPLREVLGKF